MAPHLVKSKHFLGWGAVRLLGNCPRKKHSCKKLRSLLRAALKSLALGKAFFKKLRSLLRAALTSLALGKSIL
jgi:hypothetical protein